MLAEIDWNQIIINGLTAIVSIVTILGGVLIAWFNLKSKLAANTKITQEAKDEASQARTSVENTQEAITQAGRTASVAAERAVGAAKIAGHRAEVIINAADELRKSRELMEGFRKDLSDSVVKPPKKEGNV